MTNEYNPRVHGAKCDSCPLKAHTPCSPEINPHAKMIILGESPGNAEVYEGRPFCGPVGNKVSAAIKAAGIDRTRELQLSYAVLCMPYSNTTDAQLKEATECCAPRLKNELESCDAEVVFSCGQMSLYSMTGDVHQDHHIGSFDDDGLAGKVVLQAWHPVFVYQHTPQYVMLFEAFLRRAWAVATGVQERWKWPTLHTTLDSRAIDILGAMDDSTRPVSLDVETIPDMNVLTCVGMSNGEHTITIPWDSYDTLKYGPVVGIDGYGALGRQARGLFQKILSSHTVITQNGAYDVRELRKVGLDFVNGYDLMLAHSARWPQLRHGLEWIALQYFPCPRWKTEFKSYSDEKGSAKWFKVEPQKLFEYNARDNLMQWLCHKPLDNQLDDLPATREVYNAYMRQAAIAAKASDVGILVSLDRLDCHRRDIDRRMVTPLAEITNQARELGMEGFNPASGKSLNYFFFTKLGIKPTKYSEKTGKPSLDDKTLSNVLASSAESEASKTAAKNMLRVRMYSKLKTTYIDGLEKKLDIIGNRDTPGCMGVYHPDYKVNAAITRRWGSFLHTMPGRAKVENGEVVAPGIRDIFIAPPGEWIVEADFSQQELRGIALLSGDKPWIQAYAESADIHTLTAKELFGSTDKAMRSLAKGFNFATNYCAADLEKAARGVWQVLRVDFPRLELWTVLKMLRTKYKKHPAIAEWRVKQYAHGVEHDYVEEPFSKDRRYFNGKVKETECYNYPIQRLGAYLMMLAIDNCNDWIDWDIHKMIIPNWHDAIYVTTRKPLEAARMLRQSMEKELTYNNHTMMFGVDVAIGKDLGNKVSVEKWIEQNPKWSES